MSFDYFNNLLGNPFNQFYPQQSVQQAYSQQYMANQQIQAQAQAELAARKAQEEHWKKDAIDVEFEVIENTKQIEQR
jgi:hypothetical protein